MSEVTNPCQPSAIGDTHHLRPDDLSEVVLREDEPLVILTHLLRWCRDEHRTLWEASQRHGLASWETLAPAAAWPAPGSQTTLSPALRQSLAKLLQEQDDSVPVATAWAIAQGLDHHFWHTFRTSFARRSPYQPGVGDPTPLDSPDFRGLTHMTPTSPPWRLANRLDETRHVRLAGEWAVQFRAVFDYSASSALDGLIAPTTIIATCHPNEDLTELHLGQSRSNGLFPVGPRDPDQQRQRLDALVARACQAGAQIVVLPELCTTEEIAQQLEHWVRRDDGPRLLVAGSYHHHAHPAPRPGDPPRRANTTIAWLRGHPVPLTHDKHSPGDRPRPEGIEPDGWPELRVHVGEDGFHLVIAICRDLLNPNAVHALTEVGANLVLVPAMSETLAPFVGSAANLVTASQALVAVSNNPAVWSGETAAAQARPPRALFGHPGLGQLTRLVEPIDTAPGIALMRVASGELTWLPLAPPQHRPQAPVAGQGRPLWVSRLADACLPTRRVPGEPRAQAGDTLAAVLVLLREEDRAPVVVLTTRAPGLSRYPGLRAFPGGLVEPRDPDVTQAALREAHEEIGLDPHRVEVLGVMTPVALPDDGLTVFPVLAWSDQTAWARNYAEVDDIETVPLQVLAGPPAAGPANVGDMTRAILDRVLGGALRAGVPLHDRAASCAPVVTQSLDPRPGAFIES